MKTHAIGHLARTVRLTAIIGLLSVLMTAPAQQAEAAEPVDTLDNISEPPGEVDGLTEATAAASC